MLRKLLLIVGLVAVLSFGIVAAAGADTISGRGWLKAVGYGIAKLDMTGEVYITGRGAGVITVHGAELLRVEGKGERTDLPDGTVILRGIRGRVYIAGRDMTVKIAGGKIDFTAHGSGAVYLKGRGYYETRHGRGTWSEAGIELAIAPK